LPESQRQLSNVVPVIVAAIVCDVAVKDPATGKVSLIGIFDRILVTKFSTKRPLSLYIKLTDAEGNYDIKVKYVQVKSAKILAEAGGRFEYKDRLASSDLYIPFPPLPIPEEGRYEFQIWANSIFLGRAFIDAVQR
jgi:hypothetical protein